MYVSHLLGTCLLEWLILIYKSNLNLICIVHFIQEMQSTLIYLRKYRNKDTEINIKDKITELNC